MITILDDAGALAPLRKSLKNNLSTRLEQQSEMLADRYLLLKGSLGQIRKLKGNESHTDFEI